MDSSRKQIKKTEDRPKHVALMLLVFHHCIGIHMLCLVHIFATTKWDGPYQTKKTIQISFLNSTKVGGEWRLITGSLLNDYRNASVPLYLVTVRSKISDFFFVCWYIWPSCVHCCVKIMSVQNETHLKSDVVTIINGLFTITTCWSTGNLQWQMKWLSGDN